LLIVMFFAMMSSIATSTAAARADLPDKVEKAVQVSPGYAQQLLVVSIEGKMNIAANQESSVDIMAAANQKEESIYLQAAVVPPLIAQRNSNMKVYGIQSSSDQNSLMIPIATVEVPNIGYVITSENLNLSQLVAVWNKKRMTEELSLIPEVQVKRMINPTSGSAMVTSLLKEMNQNCAATAKTKENGRQNLQNDPAKENPSAVQKRDGQGTIAMVIA
ncbi:MAG: hypothetical protein QG640_27, partial [Patescibacteria group bacterium]|nr:hypothetical protein [Patescibacteria group bacterium]